MQTRVQYPESIEPLVQFIEETPRDQILDKTLERLRAHPYANATSNYVMFPGTEDAIEILSRYRRGGPVR